MKQYIYKIISAVTIVFVMSISFISPSLASSKESRDESIVHYRTVTVDNLDIFYREAGDPEKPTILLLHGFPTSSQMFRNLIPRLADKYHLIAPDYPGFGQSSMPSRDVFNYTFKNITNIIDDFTQALGLSKYVLYVMDYGGPVGYRLAVKHPERVTALIIQNGNAYDEGLGDFWIPFRRLWLDNSTANRDALRPLFELDITRFQYIEGASDISLVSPDTWTVDQYLLDREGNKDIQLDLFYDYRTNVEQYPVWQYYFREFQPATLVVWGENDPIFTVAGAKAFKRDIKNVDFNLFDAGHFALESNIDDIVKKMKRFLKKNINK